MADRRVPLGRVYKNTKDHEVVTFKIDARVPRQEAELVLADYYVETVFIFMNRPVPPSSATVKWLRELLVAKTMNAGGGMPGDEISRYEGDDADRAYDYADKVLKRLWPT